MIRNAVPTDFDAILALNLESEHFLSPLNQQGLDNLNQEASYHRVFDINGSAVAFLLAMGAGCQYQSPNYRWFNGQYDKFLYVDRIVVSNDHHAKGIASALYNDLFDYARQNDLQRVVCEYDVEPLNQASQKFHQKYGFNEIGSQWLNGGKKRVSLQAVELGK